MLRDEWGDDSLPFYFTQIAPFKYGGTEDDPRTGYFMWAQAQTLEKIPHSGMATTVDVGEANCIHAADKATPAHRLAYLALTKDYGISGPDVDTPVAESYPLTFMDLNWPEQTMFSIPRPHELTTMTVRSFMSAPMRSRHR